ncbi:hypothetical protein [Glaciecola petra]|uniref:Uncharacterized protein n=1 Tax=Glaciecola petra TaxID=3075602 RepID=A0ABU2ZN64_9ALTE|nr:hypothetical protein [Aestuariibacter sp. P117]MDT0594058.1 hypothetical protein [Aestuariibacter sp. P117]
MKILNRKTYIHKIVVLVSVMSINQFAYAAESQEWQPISAESLVKLPANLIEKRIQQDFRLSPLSTELLAVENKMMDESNKIQTLKSIIEGAAQDQMIDEKVDLVQVKSNFLDLLQKGQQIRQSQLESKIDVYQKVLEKLYQGNNEELNSKAYQLKISQRAAKDRMQRVMQQVDDNLLQNGLSEQSPYAKEFASNLAKIDQLKDAIAAHSANLAASIDGREVSTQEYIRQLLMQSSSEQSLLDQEALMLSYMAKIVALDAQSLEFTISEIEEKQALSSAGITNTPANSVSIFL